MLVSQTIVWSDYWLLRHYWLHAFCIGRYLGSLVQRPRLKNLDLVYVCLIEMVDLWFLLFLDWLSNSSLNWLSYIEVKFGLVSSPNMLASAQNFLSQGHDTHFLKKWGIHLSRNTRLVLPILTVWLGQHSTSHWMLDKFFALLDHLRI